MAQMQLLFRHWSSQPRLRSNFSLDRKPLRRRQLLLRATLAKESEPAPHPVEIGYKVGMQVPEFGMSLLDGSTLTSASLTDQGKPTFLYFHATW